MLVRSVTLQRTCSPQATLILGNLVMGPIGEFLGVRGRRVSEFALAGQLAALTMQSHEGLRLAASTRKPVAGLAEPVRTVTLLVLEMELLPCGQDDLILAAAPPSRWHVAGAAGRRQVSANAEISPLRPTSPDPNCRWARSSHPT